MLLTAALLGYCAAGVAGCGASGTTVRLPRLRVVQDQPPRPRSDTGPSVPFPGTTNGIHLGLAFDYQARNESVVSHHVDYVWGGYFVDWNFGIDPRGPHIDAYLPLGTDGFPQSLPGHSLAAWKAMHPDWIVYQCDRTTPASAGTSDTPVPLDFSNPGVRAYQLRLVATMFARGASGIAFDNFGFENYTGRCGAYRRGVWTPLGYPEPRQTNATLDGALIRWLKEMHDAIRARFPTKTLAVNMSLQLTSLSQLRAVAPHLDGVFDESGFTMSGHDNLSGGAWTHEVESIEYLSDAGKAVDINGIVPAPNDASVTPAELNWVLSNYLLVKGSHTYTYIYAGNNKGFAGSPSGYGSFYDRPQYHIPIGHPTSNRFAFNGVQLRYYSGGLAIVNPTSTATFSLQLGQDYEDMFGHTYATVTLAPASGIVLLNPP